MLSGPGRAAAWQDRQLAAIASPAALTDPQGLILRVNAALREAVRGPVEGRFVLDLLDLHGSGSDAARQCWAAARAGAWPVQHPLPEPNGGWSRWEAGPVGDPHAGPWLHLFHRPGPEPGELLRLYSAAFDHAPIGFGLFDDQARYVYVNQKLAELNGVPVAAHLGRTIGQVLPALPPDVAERLEATIRTGEAVPPVEVSGETPAAPGERRTWLVRQYPLRRPDGQVLGAGGIAEDVTDARRVQAELAEQARVLQAQAELLTLANEAVFVRGPDDRITAWNEAAQQMYLYPEAAVLGQVSHQLLATRFPESQAALDRAIREQGFWEGELTHKRGDGQEIVVLSRQAAQYEHGQVRAILEVNWDITPRKRAEAELLQLNQTLEQRVARRTAELSQANEELEAFTYTVAHDLRAPLRSINGYADAVLEDHAAQLDAPGQEMLRRIERNVHQMDQLIHDLLQYSHLSRLQLQLQPVALSDVFAQALQELQDEVRRRAAQVQIERPLPVVQGHLTTLRQVTINLLGNALKFVQPGMHPQVRVWAEQRGTQVRVWFEDNGIGVEPRHQQRIFRVFERLHTLDAYPGTGVGLAIVRRGMERMGGRCGVQAAPRGGSRFWIELPVAGAPA
ncbi:sensor histidine kinase [Deinococcus sonorensis]|uniref:histidine kinase n=2 Tax=Deinococcus sonorensis TaxID=309891 RepID=A0AAU7U5F7_9DEIO